LIAKLAVFGDDWSIKLIPGSAAEGTPVNTTNSPPPGPEEKKETLSEKAANKAHETVNSWYYGPIIGDLVNLYHTLNRQYPREMRIAHLVVFGLIGSLLLINWLRPKPPAPPLNQSSPTSPVTSSADSGTPKQFANTSTVKKNPLPVKVTFKPSQVGKGVVIQLTGEKGAKPLTVFIHVQGALLSASRATTVQPGFTTEVGWAELNNYIVRPGHTVTITAAGYDRLSVIAY
jgi:hypothetical protein